MRAGGPGRKQRSWPRGAGLTAVGLWTPNPRVQGPAGRAFVVETYAPLSALRPAPRGRERAWSAPDARGPGPAMRSLRGRHVAGRLLGRLRPARTPVPRAAPVVVRQAGQPADERCPAARDEELTAVSGTSDRADDEKTNSR